MDIKLPKLGEGAESGVVVSIFVKEGDTVASGQTIIELENEKAVAPIPATAAGTVSSLSVKVGDRLSVGQTILSLTESGGAAPAQPVPAPKDEKETEKTPAAQPSTPQPAADQAKSAENKPKEPAPTDTHTPPGVPPPAAPSVRWAARELGIDLRAVRGSEPGGRIVMGDLRAYIERLQKAGGQAKPPTPPATGPTAPSAAPQPKPESVDFSKWGPVTKKPLAQLRQTIARRMLENWNTIPHVTQFDEADLTAINGLRAKYAAVFEAKGVKLTVTPFFLKVIAATLKKYPLFNSSLDEATNELVLKDYIHIGVAVDTEQGLIVPVVRDVDKKSLVDLAKELHTLAEKARDRKITLEELKGGSFTLSNQGAFGGGHFTPIVNKPEVAILGVGRGAAKAVVRDGKIESRPLLPLALSYDHRVIDGASAAKFVVDLVKAIETFAENDLGLE